MCMCVFVCRTLGSTRRATTQCRPLKGNRSLSSLLVTSTSSSKRWDINLWGRRWIIMNRYPYVTEVSDLLMLDVLGPLFHTAAVYFLWHFSLNDLHLVYPRPKNMCQSKNVLLWVTWWIWAQVFFLCDTIWHLASLKSLLATFEMNKWCFVFFLSPAEAKQGPLWIRRWWGVDHAWGICIPKKVCKWITYNQ